jgi:drug/metabolite transporter (DMT)-like permease
MQSASETLHHRRYLYGLLMASLGSVLFSGKAILIKLGFADGANAETLLALRMLMALPLFWGIYWWRARREIMSPLTWQDQIKLFALGFMGYFLSSYLDFLGLQYISVGLERIVLYLTPTIVLLISYFVLNKTITRLQWYALAVGYLGVIVVFIQDASSTGTMAVLGMLLVFASACTYAIYMIGSGEMVKRVGSVRLVVYASSASTLMSVIQILIYDPEAIFVQTPQIYWLSLLNASVCTVIPMLLIMIAISRIGSPLVAQSGILGPVSTLFMGWLVLSEPITWIQLCGMSLVMGAMWLLVRNDAPSKQEGFKSKKASELEGSDPLN